MKATVSIEEFANVTQVETICRGCGEISFREKNVNRPGLQIAGFFEHFKSERLQVFGQTEVTYLESLPKTCQTAALETFMSYPLAGIVVCRDMPIHKDLIRLAKEHDIPLFSTKMGTSDYISRTKQYLSYLLAPRETIHAVLVDVLGIGMLIMGDSGIGKSETALELIRHGHKLVADDAVELMLLDGGRLVGSAPETVRFLMEIRGLGIIDVRQMFGVSAVLMQKTVGAVVQLEPWETVQQMGYDRLETEKRSVDIMGVPVQKIVIPVAPGRNLASIIEIAAQNMRLESMGYHVMDEIEARLTEIKRAKNEAKKNETN